MKITLVIVNILAALAAYFSSAVIISIHNAHSISVYREFVGDKIVDVAREKEIGYRVDSKIMSAGNIHNNVTFVLSGVSVFLLFNAVAIFVIFPSTHKVKQNSNIVKFNS